jgi:poly-gamma-glutamate synthesis protein (capsule biosynthesis protein)
MTERTLIGFVGDVLVDRDDPDEPFRPVHASLAEPDVLCGNLEGVYTDDPHPAPSLGIALAPKAHNAEVFARVGFDVMSMANNHVADLGHAAMLETRSKLNALGVATCGAGENLAAARKPAIVSSKGARIAFLSYASVFPMGYEARSNVPGLAPLRAYNLYRDSLPNYQLPGVPPLIRTVPDETDHANLQADVIAARESADIVVTVFHWGDFMRPFHLTDHELRTARAAVDLGAAIVIGHHHHLLRGVEWYRDAPIFYGLGHFVFDARLDLSDELKSLMEGDAEDRDYYGIAPRRGWPLLPLHPDTRMTAIAWVEMEAGKAVRAGLLPCMLDPDGSVRPVAPTSDEGATIGSYLTRGISAHDLNAKLVVSERMLGGHPSFEFVRAR